MSRTSEPTISISDFYKTKEYERLSHIGSRIELDLLELGENIVTYNKPALEVKLTKQERLTPELDDYDNDVRPTPSPII